MWRNAAARFVNLSRRFDKIDFPSKFAISSWEPARYKIYGDFSIDLFKIVLAFNVWPRRSVHEQGEERVPEQRLNLKLSNLLITLLINDFTRIFNELQNIYFWVLFVSQAYQEDTSREYDKVHKREGAGRFPSLYRCIYAISWSEEPVWEYPIRRYFKKAKFPNLKIAT